ncbi:MAG: hypothetical protein ACK5NB_13050 [Flavobacteriaceae bacterium]
MLQLIEYIEGNPQIMVFWAAFGFIFTAGIFLYVLSQIFNLKAHYTWLGINIALTWLVGFVSQILLMFSGTSGIKLLFIWLSLFIVSFAACFFHRKELGVLYTEWDKLKTAPKNSSKRRKKS